MALVSDTLSASEMDKRIETTAQKSYVFNTYLKGDDIKLDSREGIVTLTGTVSEETHLALAAYTVVNLPGVKSIDNQLRVKGGIPEKNSDAWIRVRVKAMLMLHRNLDGTNTEVDVKEGSVSLHGKASSRAEKELTTEYVKDVEGVKTVDNQMTLTKKIINRHRMDVDFIDDSSIKSQIELALLLHRGTSLFRTSVVVNSGVVTVMGKAKNVAEKKLINSRIEDIPGVKRIYNHMTIE